MNPVTDLKMAVNNTFSSIVSEIQLSNLNFSIQMTPFAAHIILKKSTQKDQNGKTLLPSPPILQLVGEAHQEIAYLRDENKRLKAVSENLRRGNEKLVYDNAALIEDLDGANKTLEISDSTNMSLHKKLEDAEENTVKVSIEKQEIEKKLKVTKAKLVDEVKVMRIQIEALEKSKKSKEKENYDLNRNLINAHDNIKSIKSEKSQLNICKSKLEAEIKKKLEKSVYKKQSEKKNKVGLNTVSATSDSSLCCTSELVTESSSCQSILPSMVAHRIPLYSRFAPSTATMYTHRVMNGYTTENSEIVDENLIGREEIEQWKIEFREQMKKDTAKIIEEMRSWFRKI